MRVGKAARLLACAGLFALPFWLLGCSEEVQFECTADAEPAKACCAFAQAVVDGCVRCHPDKERDCVDSVNQAIEATSNGAGCQGADRIRDTASFYDACLPALEMLACDADVPQSCEDQIVYDF